MRIGTIILAWIMLHAALIGGFAGDRANTIDTIDDLQQQLDRARPGDVIEIPGGIYHGTLSFPHPGEPGRPITLRAKAGQIVVLNAGKKLDAPLTPLPERPGLWRGKVAPGMLTEKTGLWEAASKIRLMRVQTADQCARRMASWTYSPESGEVLIHPAEVVPPAQMEYWMEASEPVILAEQSHLRIEGLDLTLGQHGILLGNKTEDVAIIGCKAYCNRSAGIHLSGSRHRVIDNEVFRNNMYGIQCRYGLMHTQVKGNLCTFNGPANGETTDSSEPTDLGIYSKGAYNLFEQNIAVGFTKNVYRNKYGDNPTNLFRGNVVAGNANPGAHGVEENTFVVSSPGPRAGMYVNGGTSGAGQVWEKADPGGRQRAANLIHPAYHQKSPLFCDPDYHDYRLQAASPYRGLGAEPGYAPVYYIDPANGRASNDGLSDSAPLPSVQSALAIAPAGATLYLLPGEYHEAVEVRTGGAAGRPFSIRAWQRSGRVIITADWKIAGAIGASLENGRSPGAEDLEIDGLHFQNTRLRVENVRGLRLQGSRFEGWESGVELSGSEQITLDGNSFTGAKAAIVIGEGRDFFVTRNLFTDVATPLQGADAETLYSDFNAYRRCANPSGGQPERWSMRLSEDPAAGIPLGPRFTPPGVPQAGAAQVLKASELEVRGVSPSGATALWRVNRLSPSAEVVVETLPNGPQATYRPSMLFQIMGEYFDLSFLHYAFYSRERHLPLPGLSPGTEYRVTVTPFDAAGKRGSSATTTFRTPATGSAARTLHLSPKGNDDADGSTPGRAWRTFYHALRQLQPGDHLVLAPGVYRENIVPTISGTFEAPITIRAEVPGETILDLSDGTPTGVELLHVDHLHIEGLLLRGGTYFGGYNFLVNHARGIRIAQCEIDYPEGSSFGKPKAGYNGIVANDAPGLVIEDNLLLCGIIHVGLSNSPGAVVRHNTIFGEGNYGVVIVPGSADEEYVLEGNLFHRTILGYKAGGILRVFAPIPRITSDYNLFSIPEGHKSAIVNWPEAESFTALAQWQERTGQDRHSLVATPTFIAPAQRDFTLTAGSPGEGAARNGTNIGKRPIAK